MSRVARQCWPTGWLSLTSPSRTLLSQRRGVYLWLGVYQSMVDGRNCR